MCSTFPTNHDVTPECENGLVVKVSNCHVAQQAYSSVYFDILASDLMCEISHASYG